MSVDSERESRAPGHAPCTTVVIDDLAPAIASSPPAIDARRTNQHNQHDLRAAGTRSLPLAPDGAEERA
jgi:hypothetical protein